MVLLLPLLLLLLLLLHVAVGVGLTDGAAVDFKIVVTEFAVALLSLCVSVSGGGRTGRGGTYRAGEAGGVEAATG